MTAEIQLRIRQEPARRERERGSRAVAEGRGEQSVLTLSNVYENTY